MISNKSTFFMLALVSLQAVLPAVPALGQAPDDQIDKPAPDSFLVAFETSQGRFEAMAHRAWSPLAADRFFHLVRLGFLDGLSVFRVVGGYVAQFGIHNELAVNRAWDRLGIEDEPVRHSNRRGTISFARAGPKSRTTQIFINLADNQALDALNYGGVAGYPPFAEIVSGMDTVVDAFNAQYGNDPAMHQDSIRAAGRAYLDRAYPGLDTIISARIERTYP